MYAELELKLRTPIERHVLSPHIERIVGANAIPTGDALFGTFLQSEWGLRQSALLAEQIANATTVVYFMEGNDVIKAHIFVPSLVAAKKQCARIARQISAKIDSGLSARARVLLMVDGGSELLAIGELVPFRRRLRKTFSEKILVKFAAAATAFALAAMTLPGTTVFASAAIGFVAACAGAGVDVFVTAIGFDDWQWKDAS